MRCGRGKQTEALKSDNRDRTKQHCHQFPATQYNAAPSFSCPGERIRFLFFSRSPVRRSSLWSVTHPLGHHRYGLRAETPRRHHKLKSGGADFAALAKERSIDPSASDGGYLGHPRPVETPPRTQRPSPASLRAALSEVVKIPSGYAILKVLSDSAPAPPPPPHPPPPDKRYPGAAAVRLTYDYAGFASALRAVERFPKPPAWDTDLQSACEVRNAADACRDRAAAPLLNRPGAPPAFLRDANSLLGDLTPTTAISMRPWHTGRRATKSRCKDFPDRATANGGIHRRRLSSARRARALRRVRLPQALNTALTPQQKDDLAPGGRLLHPLSEACARRWRSSLAAEPRLHAVRAHIRAGVPADYLIPPAVFESNETVVHFTNAAPAAGLTRTGQAGGVIVDDFDNDGLLDVDDFQRERLRAAGLLP